MSQFLRLLAIQKVLISHGLDEIIFATHLFRPVRLLFYILPWNWFRKNTKPRAKRMRNMLEELGPIYVKFGQILSTRRDFIPEDIADEFAELQDNVTPFPGKIARKIIEDAYGCNIDEVFLEFDEIPLASASVAQVHGAKLKDGRDFIIKVIRPGIDIIIKKDLDLLKLLATKAEIYNKHAKSLKFTGVIEEFEKTIFNELDLQREASNASQLYRNFENEDRYYVPKIDWSLTRRNVLAIERIEGISIRSISALKTANIDLKSLAEFGVEIFFKQVFRDNFFHADMHPGNIFVSPGKTSEQPILKVIDFGIMCSLTDYDRHYLANNLMAFLNYDYHKVAVLHIKSGWVPKETRVDELEAAIRTVCEPLLDRPIHEISLGELLQRLLQIARSFDVKIMPQLILLQKTIINIEGIGRQLYPELNLWDTARPEMERWMNERVSIKAFIKNLTLNLPSVIERLPDLPNRGIDLIDKFHNGEVEIRNKSEEIDRLRLDISKHNRRTIMAVIGSGFVLSSAIIYALNNTTHGIFFTVPVISWVLGFFGLIFIYFSWKD
ncbi:MAG: 2-polyprenylphenol 6-hydroxylase [Legionellales bacterium]|nr:2-polyprenylphenol 6-hydroxylase [Legionellales bacterium]